MGGKPAFVVGGTGNEILVAKVLLDRKSTEVGAAYEVGIVPSLVYGQWIGQLEGTVS